MDNKDKYVLNKIYTHIVSVLKYCEIWNEEQDCSWIWRCWNEICMGHDQNGFTTFKGRIGEIYQLTQ